MSVRKHPRRMKWCVALLLLGAVGTAPWWPRWYWSWRTDNPVRRGARLAEKAGCLSCHMPRGIAEFANPGSRWGTVPSFFRGNAMMYVKSQEDVAYFIAEGHAPGAEGQPQHGLGDEGPPFRMKAFKSSLSVKDIRDLAAFVLAADGMLIPADGPVAKGQALSLKFGCESCHGTYGSGGIPNARSFTGMVPGWTGEDFDHLVRGRAEFGEWVLHGRSARFRQDRAASFFLDRARLQMPAFRSALKDSDVDDIWSYVLWLRSEREGLRGRDGKSPAHPANK